MCIQVTHELAVLARKKRLVYESYVANSRTRRFFYLIFKSTHYDLPYHGLNHTELKNDYYVKRHTNWCYTKTKKGSPHPGPYSLIFTEDYMSKRHDKLQ